MRGGIGRSGVALALQISATSLSTSPAFSALNKIQSAVSVKVWRIVLPGRRTF
jgi:hypothetical protein